MIDLVICTTDWLGTYNYKEIYSVEEYCTKDKRIAMITNKHGSSLRMHIGSMFKIIPNTKFTRFLYGEI